MSPLLGQLIARIDDHGPISVAEYMETALGHPEHGYYRRRDPLGRTGDFVTAPEISQVFGELIGLWCAEYWLSMGRPDPVVVAELGPGRGTLMADFLRATAVLPGFRDALSLHLVETSPALRERQKTTLRHVRPTWHEHWSTLPPGPILLIANEFIDALPIRQYVRRSDGWHERLVGHQGDTLRFEDGPTADPGLPDFGEGEVFEVNEAAAGLARFLGARIDRDGGAALLVDYGHGSSAPGDTLQAVRRHAFAPVLEAPGESDLSAHVDFAALARAAAPAGAHGPVAQGLFLTRLGLGERVRMLTRSRPDKAADILSGCRRLIEEREMGTLFKVMALVPHDVPPPPGFTVRL